MGVGGMEGKSTCLPGKGEPLGSWSTSDLKFKVWPRLVAQDESDFSSFLRPCPRVGASISYQLELNHEQLRVLSPSFLVLPAVRVCGICSGPSAIRHPLPSPEEGCLASQ